MYNNLETLLPCILCSVNQIVDKPLKTHPPKNSDRPQQAPKDKESDASKSSKFENDGHIKEEHAMVNNKCNVAEEPIIQDKGIIIIKVSVLATLGKGREGGTHNNVKYIKVGAIYQSD